MAVLGALFVLAAAAAAAGFADCRRDNLGRLGTYALPFAALLVAVTYSASATVLRPRVDRADPAGAGTDTRQQNAGDPASVLLPNHPKEITMTSTRDETVTDPGCDTKEQAPNRTEPPPSSTLQAPAWRGFDFPSDHVLLFGCSGDELTVRIMPRLDGFEAATPRVTCRTAASGRPEAGTLSNYNRDPHYQALFWSRPGEEKFVPVPLPLTDKDREVLPEFEVAPEAFTLSTDVVVFYRSMPSRSEIHIMARDVVGFMPTSQLEDAREALRPLNPFTVVCS